LAAFPNQFPRRGEVYWTDFGTPRGSEQGGRRPAVIVSGDIANERSPVVVVAATSTTIPSRQYPWNVPLPATGGLTRDGTILCNQLRVVSKERHERYTAKLTQDQIRQLSRGLAVAVGLIVG
jgi:mRNA interferase MazF